jgi:hypothetical protein
MFGSKIDPKVRRKLDEIGVDDVRARLEAINRVRDLGQEDAQNSGDGISASRADLRSTLRFVMNMQAIEGNSLKKRINAKLSKPDDNARVLPILPALRATADYEWLRQASPCYR